MGIRNTVGSMLESTIGRERTNTIRKAERSARNALAKRLATEPPPRNRHRSRPPSPPPKRLPLSLRQPLGARAGSRLTRSCLTRRRE